MIKKVKLLLFAACAPAQAAARESAVACISAKLAHAAAPATITG